MSPDRLFTSPASSWLVRTRPRCSVTKESTPAEDMSLGSLDSLACMSRRDDVPPHSLKKSDCIIFSHNKLTARSLRPHTGASLQKVPRKLDSFCNDTPVMRWMSLKMSRLSVALTLLGLVMGCPLCVSADSPAGYARLLCLSSSGVLDITIRSRSTAAAGE